MVIQVLRARNPRDRSVPRSHGHHSPPAIPRVVQVRYAAWVENASRSQYPSATRRESRVVRHLRPLAKVEGDAVGATDARIQRLQFRRKNAQSAECAVDVK